MAKGFVNYKIIIYNQRIDAKITPLTLNVNLNVIQYKGQSRLIDLAFHRLNSKSHGIQT